MTVPRSRCPRQHAPQEAQIHLDRTRSDPELASRWRPNSSMSAVRTEPLPISDVERRGSAGRSEVACEHLARCVLVPLLPVALLGRHLNQVDVKQLAEGDLLGLRGLSLPEPGRSIIRPPCSLVLGPYARVRPVSVSPCRQTPRRAAPKRARRLGPGFLPRCPVE